MIKSNLILLVFSGIFTIITAVSCKTVSEVKTVDSLPVTEVKSVENLEQMKENKDKSVLVYGTIIQEDFVNKGGRTTGIKETLIKLSDGETVHLRNKGENKYDYDKLVNKKVELEAVIFYGNIDSDNPEHQSRVGYRIDYTRIKILD